MKPESDYLASDQFVVGTRCPSCPTMSATMVRLGSLILDGWDKAVGHPPCPSCGEPMDHTGRGWQPHAEMVGE